MILDILVSEIISSGSVPKKDSYEYDVEESYINYCLGKRSDGFTPIVISSSLSKCYHERLIKAAEKAGWIVTISPGCGFYQWQETYNITFVPSR